MSLNDHLIEINSMCIETKCIWKKVFRPQCAQRFLLTKQTSGFGKRVPSVLPLFRADVWEFTALCRIVQGPVIIRYRILHLKTFWGQRSHFSECAFAAVSLFFFFCFFFQSESEQNGDFWFVRCLVCFSFTPRQTFVLVSHRIKTTKLKKCVGLKTYS